MQVYMIRDKLTGAWFKNMRSWTTDQQEAHVYQHEGAAKGVGTAAKNKSYLAAHFRADLGTKADPELVTFDLVERGAS